MLNFIIMWAFILNDYSQYLELSGQLPKWQGLDYESLETPFAAHVCLPKNDTAPILAHSDINSGATRDLLLWIQNRKHPHAFVHCGFAHFCESEAAAPEIYIPTWCARSVGRLDIAGTGHVPYEEISFETVLIAELEERARYDSSIPSVSSARKVFAPSREVTLPDELKWIHRHIDCSISSHGLNSFIDGCQSLGCHGLGFYVIPSGFKPNLAFISQMQALLAWKSAR
jgi:hypothetical protein